ncbi:hypothetical protein AV521_23575 [Streptomyces sp. IMTB 2501]|uniref:DUF2637 domain-containing protein n=1 Tax=Streptomyces sp. IMTB 2501 TaxID=1776340 RepID=UPI00096CA73F|nr:DUF2637 domain-containing protein [Streptomyces sp. IMTB 2501]OLZ67855.1 hypothetical protein AV521_23575 [Streptomyces sp. IMTB 2501]
MPSRTTPTPAPILTAAIRIGVALVGTIGFALSYDALRQMAVAIHVRGILTYAFPLVIDGFIAIGVAALLILRTAPWRSRLYVWALVGIATITSIWANALHAVRLNEQAHTTGLHLDDVTVGALSAIAPLALAGAVHLDLVIRRHPARHVQEAAATKSHNAPVHGHSHTVSAAPNPPSEGDAGLPEHAEMPDVAGHPGDVVRDAVNVPQAQRPLATAESHERDGIFNELLALARTAPLGRGGRASRRNIETAIRDAGFPIGKDRLTQIKDRVQAELDQATRQRHAEPDKEPAGAL